MKGLTQSVANVFAYDRIATLVGLSHDCVANRAYRAAGLQRVDCQMHTIESRLRDTNCLFGCFTDEIGFRLIAVLTVDDASNVDIDDVAVFEFF